MPPEDLALIAEVLAGFRGGPRRAEVSAVAREEIDAFRGGDGHEAALSFLEDVPPLRAGTADTVDVLLENRSNGTWPWGGELGIGSRWVRSDETVEGEWSPLPAGLAPGASARVPVALAAPPGGSWTLEIALVPRNGGAFDAAIRADVDVEGDPPPPVPRKRWRR